MIKDKYLTSKEVAKILGYVPAHIRRLIIQGKIKAEKIGHTWLISSKAISHIVPKKGNDLHGSD